MKMTEEEYEEAIKKMRKPVEIPKKEEEDEEEDPYEYYRVKREEFLEKYRELEKEAKINYLMEHRKSMEIEKEEEDEEE